uniref:Uncharacterized protein n=1 Tax=Crocodylus porosus TaxID=8502 RepID=A0A7M4EV65_CROPO
MAINSPLPGTVGVFLSLQTGWGFLFWSHLLLFCWAFYLGLSWVCGRPIVPGRHVKNVLMLMREPSLAPSGLSSFFLFELLPQWLHPPQFYFSRACLLDVPPPPSFSR